MLIGAITPVYNDEEIVGSAIKCFRPFVDKYIALISEIPYYGEPQPPDRTEEICRSLDVDIIKGRWKKDHEQRNRGLELCSDCDWIFNIDADELMLPEEVEAIIKLAKNTKYDAIGVNPEVYWRNVYNVLRPKPTFNPILMTRTKVRFNNVRNIDSSRYAICDAQMHHIAWCEPKNIYKKIKTYVHANECKDIEHWYQKNYLGWKEGDRAIDPMGNSFDVEHKPLPEELRKLLGVV